MKRRLFGTLVLSFILGLPVARAGEEKHEKFNGYAEWRRGDLLIVDGQRVRVGESARIRVKGDIADWTAVPLGYEVKGKGSRLADGTLVAQEIELKPNGNAFFERELSASFDAMEQEFRRRGRVAFTDEYDRVVVDYGALYEQGPPVERIRRIAARVAPSYVAPTDFRVYVVENKDWNAMAAPNYSIYVFTGLLEALDDDEVAIVLGHELAHATHEHSRKGFKRSLMTQLISIVPWAVAEATIESPTRRALAQVGIALGFMALENGYSRDQEDQADRVGLRYAYEGGYDVRKGPRLWERFADKYGNGNVVLNFLMGGHSRALVRAHHLEREIALNY